MPNKMIAVIAFFLMTVAAFCAPPFEWEAKSAGNSLTVTARVAPGNYFYANSLILVVTGADGSAAAMTSSPEAVPHHDEFLGDVGIYPAGTHVWKFTGMPPFKATVNYQGCREKTAESPAMCFLPKKLDLIPAASPLAELEEKAAAAEVGKEEFKLDRKVIGLQNVPQFKAFLTGTDVGEAENSGFGADAGWLWIVLLTVLGGLGLNLTPCVLPMIPVNLAIIGADGADKMTGFRRGLAYGIGMAAAYGILGVAVILTGARFGELNASSWFNFAIAAVFVVLALAMFGLFNLDLSGKVNVKPSRIKGGKTVVALVMGAVAALLAGACVAPVVIAVLVLAAERFQSGNVLALGLPFCWASAWRCRGRWPEPDSASCRNRDSSWSRSSTCSAELSCWRRSITAISVIRCSRASIRRKRKSPGSKPAWPPPANRTSRCWWTSGPVGAKTARAWKRMYSAIPKSNGKWRSSWS